MRHLKPLHGVNVRYHCWNPAPETGRPKVRAEWGGEELLEGLVRGTDYEEVSKVASTSGCSPQEPYWSWAVMGAVDCPVRKGVQLVCPGDYLVFVDGMHVQVMSEVQFRNFILKAEQARRDAK